MTHVSKLRNVIKNGANSAIIRSLLFFIAFLPFGSSFLHSSPLSFPPSSVFQRTASSTFTSLSSSSVSSTSSTQEEETTSTSNSNSNDEEYPYVFTGRLCFLPSLVPTPKSSQQLNSNDVSPISLFGYTLGGTVALEYDTSPIGPYREYVTMSSLVRKLGPEQPLALGQWGSRLYVSTEEAEVICRKVWGVPAKQADIDFIERNDGGDCLKVTKRPDPNYKREDEEKNKEVIRVVGWENTRILTPDEYTTSTSNTDGARDGTVETKKAKRWGNIPVYWTPTIKALWAPTILPDLKRIHGNVEDGEEDGRMPLHKLRLSASAVRLHWFGVGRHGNDSSSKEGSGSGGGGISLGVGLIVDNVSIEIGTRCGSL